MGSVLRGSIHFRVLVLVVAAGVLGVGLASLRSAPVDVLPEFTPPYAEVQTEALGLSADEVEQLITVPLEADLLNGVEGIEVIRSESVPSLSSIVMVFAPGTDIYRARQLVEERLTQAHALPNVSKPPALLQPLSSSKRVLMIGLSSEQVSAIEQSVIARWTVRPRLMGVPGVANVSVWGMRDQQLQVQVDPTRLRDQGVTLNQVIHTAGNAQVVSPLSFLEASTPGTGGFIETPQQRLQVRHLIEKIADPAELGNVPVEGTDGRLRLADVANIQIDHQPLIGDAVVAGGAGLVLVVEKFPGADTLAVTEGVENALDTLRPGLSGIQTDTSIFRPATYIEDAIGNLRLALAVGGLLMVLTMFALRFHWRAVLLALATVPLSLVVAALLLRLLGQGINAIALAGLAAGVAVVVDEAVAPTEAVLRRLQERNRNGGRAPLSSAVREASSEVRRPLVFATLIVLLAIVPAAVLSGRPGAFLAPVVLAYVLAVAAAMLVALIVTPALTVVLFARWQPNRAPSRMQQRVTTTHQAAFGWVTRRARGALLAAGVCAVLGIVVAPFLGMSLIPTFQDRDVLVRLETEPGTSNPRMTEITTEVTRQLQAVPGVGNVGAHVGRAVMGDRVTNVSSSDVWVSIDSDADHEATLEAINAVVGTMPGVQSEVSAYSSQKLRDVGALTRGENLVTGNDLGLLTGVDKPLTVRLFGEDPDLLRSEASRVQGIMSEVDGVVDPQIELPTVQPTVEIEVDLDKARAFGLTPGDVRRAEATLLQGIQVGSIFQQQKVFDVIVQGGPSTRGSVENVRSLLIDRPGGGHVTLAEVADVRVVDAPSVIERDAVSRRLDVQADISGRSRAAVVDEIQSRLETLSFPMAYHAEVLDEVTSEETGSNRVLGFAIAAAIAGFLLLQAAFRSWRLAALVFATLPLCLVGGLVAALVVGDGLSLGSLLGLLAVFGLATRTSVLLIVNLQSLEPRAGESRAALVQRGTTGRLGPVLTSTTALAALVLPLAILGSPPGLELLHPMALVVLAGLVTSTVTTLLVLPALYLQLGFHEEPEGSADRAERDPMTEFERDHSSGDGWPGQRFGSVNVPGGETVK